MIMIDKAILKINPNAECTINANDINQITWINGTTPISKEDIEAMLPIVEQEMKDAEQAKIDKKASGKQKLKDLGLDDDEIQALIGA
jgi:transcriptional regulator NrdR family protein